jgi:hypothetical protein
MISLRNIFLECVVASDSVSLALTLNAIAYNTMLVNYLSLYGILSAVHCGDISAGANTNGELYELF